MPVNSTHPDYDMRLPAWSRALKLVHILDPDTGLGRGRYVVQVWRGQASEHRRKKSEWVLVEERTPLRLGQPLEHIPFVFHGPNHSLPHVDKLLPGDLIAANLDHYRPNPDYKHEQVSKSLCSLSAELCATCANSRSFRTFDIWYLSLFRVSIFGFRVWLRLGRAGPLR